MSNSSSISPVISQLVLRGVLCILLGLGTTCGDDDQPDSSDPDPSLHTSGEHQNDTKSTGKLTWKVENIAPNDASSLFKVTLTNEGDGKVWLNEHRIDISIREAIDRKGEKVKKSPLVRYIQSEVATGNPSISKSLYDDKSPGGMPEMLEKGQELTFGLTAVDDGTASSADIVCVVSGPHASISETLTWKAGELKKPDAKNTKLILGNIFSIKRVAAEGEKCGLECSIGIQIKNSSKYFVDLGSIKLTLKVHPPSPHGTITVPSNMPSIRIVKPLGSEIIDFRFTAKFSDKKNPEEFFTDDTQVLVVLEAAGKSFTTKKSITPRWID